MKFAVGLLMSASALPNSLRQRRDTPLVSDCPGRCWELKDGKCVPMEEKVRIIKEDTAPVPAKK